MKQVTNTVEEWRDVPGLEGRYEVSSNGGLRSLDRVIVYTDGRRGLFKGRTLALARGAGGYLGIAVKGRRYLVHRLVASAFLPPVAGKTSVNHRNGDKRDNRLVNLEWCSLAENNRHARDTGLQKQHGESNNLTRYAEQLVSAVRRVHDRYAPTYRELALLFDMSEMQAADIVKGRTRKRE